MAYIIKSCQVVGGGDEKDVVDARVLDVVSESGEDSNQLLKRRHVLRDLQ